MDWISALGSICSFFGVLIALRQISKVRASADAAKDAAESAASSVQKNMAMIDVSSCINEIEEIKVLIRNSRHESALLRVNDLIGKIIQLKAIPETDKFNGINNISSMLGQLGVLRDLLEKKLHKTSTSVNSSQVNKILSTIADELHEWIGVHKYSHSGDEK